MKNDNIRDLILNWEIDKISFFGNDIKYVYDDFYEKAFLPIFKKLLEEFSCFGLNCKEIPNKIYPFCFEPLCLKCYDNHRCKATIFEELNIIHNNLPSVEEQMDSLNKELLSLQKITIIKISNDYKKDVYPVHLGIKKVVTNTKRKILHYEKYINSIIFYMESNFKRVIDDKLNALENLLVQYLEVSDEIQKKNLQDEIVKCEKFIDDSNFIFESTLKNMSVFRNIEKMYSFSMDYLQNLEIYYDDILKTTFDEINNFISSYLMNLKLDHDNIEMDLMMNNDPIIDFYFPEEGTNKLNRIFNIKIVEEKSYFTTSEETLTFSKKIESKIIPTGSRYIRIKNYIHVSGGYDDALKSGLKQNGLISIKTLKYKLRKSQMVYSRYNHSLLLYNEIFVIAVGGSDSNTVEMYGLLIDKWTALPSLNNKRANSTLILIDNGIVYCFGGEYNDILLDSIETIDLTENLMDLSKKKSDLTKKISWTLIEYTQNKAEIDKLFSGSSFGVIKKSDKKLLLFGGKVFDERDQIIDSSDYLYEYDTVENNFISLYSYFEKCYFLETNLIDIGIKGYRFQVCFSEGNYNLFNFKIS